MARRCLVASRLLFLLLPPPVQRWEEMSFALLLSAVAAVPAQFVATTCAYFHLCYLLLTIVTSVVQSIFVLLLPLLVFVKSAAILLAVFEFLRWFSDLPWTVKVFWQDVKHSVQLLDMENVEVEVCTLPPEKELLNRPKVACFIRGLLIKFIAFYACFVVPLAFSDIFFVPLLAILHHIAVTTFFLTCALELTDLLRVLSKLTEPIDWVQALESHALLALSNIQVRVFFFFFPLVCLSSFGARPDRVSSALLGKLSKFLPSHKIRNRRSSNRRRFAFRTIRRSSKNG